MRVLVISQCTKKKSHKECMAIDMYQGGEHNRISEGIQHLWKNMHLSKHRQDNGYPQALHWYILSADYGLINNWKKIKPSEKSFSYMFRNEDIKSYADSKNVHSIAQDLINQYDLVIYLLGREYLVALGLPFETGNNFRAMHYGVGETPFACKYDVVKQLFFVAPTNHDMIPDIDGVEIVPSGKDLSKIAGVSWMEIKGEMFRRICYATADEGFEVFDRIRTDVTEVKQIVENHNDSQQQLDFTLKGEFDES